MKGKKWSSVLRKTPRGMAKASTPAQLPKPGPSVPARNLSRLAAFAGYKYQPQAPSQPNQAERPIVIRHENLENASDPELVIAKVLAQAMFWFLVRAGINPLLSPEQICENLLSKLGKVVSPSTIHEIISLKAEERKPHIDALKRRLAEVADQLGPLLSRRRGPKRKGERDRRILKMKESGLSYGQIASKLGIQRLTVQSAYRREHARRDEAITLFRSKRPMFEKLGIAFIEQKEPPPTLKP